VFLSDIVKTEVATVQPGFTVREAAKHMLDSNVGALVIVDGESRPVGIITDRDIVGLLAEGVDPDDATIGVFAGQMLQTASVLDSLRSVTEKMHKHGVRRLPVIDSDGKLAGIISLDDLLIHLGRQMGDIAETVRNELSHERVLSMLRKGQRE
jgi:CBS domain-containing protein